MNYQKIMQDLLKPPIAFQRSFVDAGGSVLAGLMLSQAYYWTLRTEDTDGWFFKTQKDWEDETGMTRYEQEGARKKLRSTGFWQEELRGVPAKLFFRIDIPKLLDFLATKYAEIPHTGTGNFPVQVRGNSPSFNSKSTTETTTETTVVAAAAAAAQTETVVSPKPPTPTAAIPKPPATKPPPASSEKRNRKTDPEWDAICSTYENEIGLLTPLIADHLGELADKYPLPWITLALAEAVKANVRKLNYAARILERWHTEGRETVNANRNYAPTTYHNGKSSTYGRDNSPPRRDNGVPVPEEPSAEEWERIDALLAGKPWPPIAQAQSG